MPKLVKDEVFEKLVPDLLDRKCSIEPTPRAIQLAETEVKATAECSLPSAVREQAEKKLPARRVWEVRYRPGKGEELVFKFTTLSRLDAWVIAAHLRYRAEQLSHLELYEEVPE